MNKLEILQRIVDNHQCEKVRINGRKVLIDGTSAAITLKVYNSVNEANKAKMLAMELDKMILIAIKAAQRAVERS